MVSIASLWLPILVSAAGCFVMSSLIWMVFKYHMQDWKKLPDEAGLLEALRKQGSMAGWYMFPHCSFADIKTPEGKARYERGPWGTVTMAPGMHNMGRSMGIWFVHLVIVGVAIAWVAGSARAPGAEFMEVAKLAGVMALLIHAGHELPGMAWKAQPGDIAVRNLIDAVLYAAITGASFGWLWPDAAA